MTDRSEDPRYKEMKESVRSFRKTGDRDWGSPQQLNVKVQTMDGIGPCNGEGFYKWLGVSSVVSRRVAWRDRFG